MNRYKYFSLFFKKPELMVTIASAEIYNLESIALQQNKYINIEHALNYWSKIKAKKNLDSRDIMVGEGLGYYLLQMKNYDKVMEICQDILQSKSDNEIALHLMGRIHHEKSQIDKARYYYQKVLDKNPKNVATLINMGMIARSEDKPEKAKQYYYRALSVDSTNLEARLNLGNLFFIIGKTDQAEEHYTFVIKKILRMD